MHSSSMSTRIAVLALPLTLAACSGMGMPGKADVPASIAVPSGNTPAFTLKGTGLQNYECRAKADAPGGHDWVFVAPEAALRDKNDALVGRHYGGPTWEHGDGSKVVGKVVASAPAPVAGNIPWLLLQGTSTGTGAFRDVTYIQRTNTSGGVAPSDPCAASTVGRKSAVRYSADYLFFKP
jgi:Protein of unknown function (DUF3455)